MKIHRKESEIRRKYVVLHVMCPSLLINHYVAHARKVRGLKFQENPSTGNRETDEKVLCSPSKVPFIIDYRNQTYTVCTACIENFT
jgi:hypothetical protein